MNTFLTRHGALIIQMLCVASIALAIVLKEVGTDYTEAQFGYSLIILGVAAILVYSMQHVPCADGGTREPKVRTALLGTAFILFGLDRTMMPFDDDHWIATTMLILFDVYLVLPRLLKRRRD